MHTVLQRNLLSKTNRFGHILGPETFGGGSRSRCLEFVFVFVTRESGFSIFAFGMFFLAHFFKDFLIDFLLRHRLRQALMYLLFETALANRFLDVLLDRLLDILSYGLPIDRPERMIKILLNRFLNIGIGNFLKRLITILFLNILSNFLTSILPFTLSIVSIIIVYIIFIEKFH